MTVDSYDPEFKHYSNKQLAAAGRDAGAFEAKDRTALCYELAIRVEELMALEKLYARLY